MRTLIKRVRDNAAKGIEPDNLLVKEILALEEPEREQELIELVISMVLGSHETTARMMLGAFYFLMKHPAYIKQIRDETRSFFAQEQRTLDYDVVMKSPYFNRLRTVVEEAIRLTPPVWLLARTPTEDLHFSDDMVIPKGTEILISSLFLQRDKSLWGENAEAFFPERHDALPDAIRARYKPFIDGLHKCPGQYFAKMEAALAIAGLFMHFDMELLNQEELPKPVSAGTFRLFNELMVVIRERS